MAASVEAVAEVEVGLDVHVTLEKFELLSTWIVYCVGVPVEAFHEKAGVVSFVYVPFEGDESAGTEGATLSKRIVSPYALVSFPAESLNMTYTVFVPCVFASVQDLEVP